MPAGLRCWADLEQEGVGADSKSPIWRRALVLSDTTRTGLHDAIQAVSGWWDSHLHEFIVGETHHGEPDSGMDDELTLQMRRRDERTYRIIAHPTYGSTAADPVVAVVTTQAEYIYLPIMLRQHR